jgi:hypothetical protein
MSSSWGTSWSVFWGNAWGVVSGEIPVREIFTYSRSAPADPVAKNPNQAIIEQDDEAILAFVRSFINNLTTGAHHGE